MNIIWTDFAKENIRAIYNFYKINVDEEVALNQIGEIIESIPILKNFPESGKELEMQTDLALNYRYLIINTYKVIYRIENNSIYILDVFDTHQNPQKMLDTKRLKRD